MKRKTQMGLVTFPVSVPCLTPGPDSVQCRHVTRYIFSSYHVFIFWGNMANPMLESLGTAPIRMMLDVDSKGYVMWVVVGIHTNSIEAFTNTQNWQ